MRRSPALLVALLLVVTVGPAAGIYGTVQPVAATDHTGTLNITAINGTTNQLAIPAGDLQRAEFNSTGINVGVAIASGSRQLHQEHESRSFERRFYRAESDAARTELVRDRLGALEETLNSLEHRQERSTEQYSSGSATATEFVETRVLVDAQARQLSTALARIERAEQNTPEYSMPQAIESRLENTKGNIRILQGPIAARLSTRVLRGADVGHVYVETGTDGYMLAMIDDDQYVRETYLGSQRAPGEPDQFALDDTDRLRAAADRAESLYPWLYDRQRASVLAYGSTSIYQITADHSEGELTSYIDGGTTDVFREVQFRQLSTVTVTETETEVHDSVRLDVNRAYETGPLLVSVDNNETGMPVDGSVSIDGRQIGSTGRDGVLWTVEPRGEYTVSVNTTDGTQLVTTVPAR